MSLTKLGGFFITALMAVFSAELAVMAINYVIVSPSMNTAAVTANTANTDRVLAQTAMSVTDRNIFAIDKTAPIVASAPQANTAAASGTAYSAPASAKLNMRLTGVLLATPKAESRAIIIKDGQDISIVNTYKTVNGMLLKSATINSVVITYGGNEHTLTIEEGQETVAAASRSPATTASSARAPIIQRETAPTTATASSSGDTEQYTVERSEVMQQLSDINSVLRSMLVSPAYEGSEFMGYRISRMNEDAPLTTLGLKQGDIINRLNGEELTNPQLLFDMLARIGDIDAVSVDITRDSEKKTIFVEIQ